MDYAIPAGKGNNAAEQCSQAREILTRPFWRKISSWKIGFAL